ncbi:MAG TPA: DUF4147 domain-containing protein [Thermoanaerobaculia bacterium]|nr:DUF4147 domain-containing protein [Thermoanaerobaculia bacterium]
MSRQPLSAVIVKSRARILVLATTQFNPLDGSASFYNRQVKSSIARRLREVFDVSLRRCDPATLTRSAIERSKEARTVDVVALGKCAAAMLSGAAATLDIRRSFMSVPAGYPVVEGVTELRIGSHPQLSPDSFAAGESLLRFIDRFFPTLFLISGGSSACVEAPLKPWFDAGDLVEINRVMLRSGLAIEGINTVRKHLSAIKGGRLASVTGHSVTFVLSDVGTGALHLVGSGPTLADPTSLGEAAAILRRLPGDCAASIAERLESGQVPETPKSGARPHLAGDNSTLVRAAADEVTRLGLRASIIDREMTGDVQSVARELFTIATRLATDEVAIAGGEPTVVVNGEGRGGRCGEVAARFAMRSIEERRGDVCGLFAASDGVDGNSGTAGAVVFSGGAGPVTATTDEISRALERSDSRSILEKIGEPIIIPATGNNVRDLFLVARDSGPHFSQGFCCGSG